MRRMSKFMCCDLCKGKGIVNNCGFAKWCPKCCGMGVVNWIENIFGKSDLELSDDEKLEKKLESKNTIIINKLIQTLWILMY